LTGKTTPNQGRKKALTWMKHRQNDVPVYTPGYGKPVEGGQTLCVSAPFLYCANWSPITPCNREEENPPMALAISKAAKKAWQVERSFNERSLLVPLQRWLSL